MGQVVVLGESVRVMGYALAGAVPIEADHPEQVRLAWQTLPADVELVVITPAAAEALGDEVLRDVGDRLIVTMPS